MFREKKELDVTGPRVVWARVMMGVRLGRTVFVCPAKMLEFIFCKSKT